MDTSNNEIYKDLEDGKGLFMPSYMGIIPRDDNFALSEEYIIEAIEKNKDFELKSITSNIIEDWDSYELKIEYKDEIYTALLAKQTNNPEQLKTFSFGNKIEEEEQLEALNKEFYIDISTVYQSDAMVSYLFQLKLMDAIVPEACMLIDLSAMTVLAADWLKMTVKANIPPAPKYLYSIHAVYEAEAPEPIYWLHTHGLLRCGSMELEIVNLKLGAQEIYNLLITAANLFIKEHYKEKEKFAIGYDGLDLNLAWIRWEDALKQFPDTMLGGIDERKGEDNPHAEPSGILYAVEDKNTYMSPEIYATTLADNPIIYISSEETLRMRMLAIEHFDVLEQAFKIHGVEKTVKKSFFGKIFGHKDKEDAEKWTFLVKLGLVVDNAEEENEKEHLWYEVVSIENGIVTGKLTNQPYWIASLKVGDVKAYPVNETLTDWIVYSPEETFVPDTAYSLIHELEYNS